MSLIVTDILYICFFFFFNEAHVLIKSQIDKWSRLDLI